MLKSLIASFLFYSVLRLKLFLRLEQSSEKKVFWHVLLRFAYSFYDVIETLVQLVQISIDQTSYEKQVRIGFVYIVGLVQLF